MVFKKRNIYKMNSTELRTSANLSKFNDVEQQVFLFAMLSFCCTKPNCNLKFLLVIL